MPTEATSGPQILIEVTEGLRQEIIRKGARLKVQTEQATQIFYVLRRAANIGGYNEFTAKQVIGERAWQRIARGCTVFNELEFNFSNSTKIRYRIEILKEEVLEIEISFFHNRLQSFQNKPAYTFSLFLDLETSEISDGASIIQS